MSYYDQLLNSLGPSSSFNLPPVTPPAPGFNPGAALGYSGAGAGTTAGSSGGFLSSLLGRVGVNAVNPESAGLLGRYGFMGARAGIARAIPGVAVAEFGPKVVNALPLPNQGSKDILGNVVAGAGIGAAAGAPFEGVGALPGALIGGGIGLGKGLLEQFGGDDEKPDYKTALTTSASQLGLNPANYTAAYDLLTKAGGDQKTVSAKLAQQLLQDSAQKQALDQANTQQQAQRASDQKFALALQAQAQQFFGPYTNNIISAGQSQADSLRHLATQVPEAYRGVFENQAVQAQSGAQRLAGAYAMQSAIMPQQFMAAAELKREQDLQTLAYRQAVVQAQQNKGGGGFNGLVNQLQPSTTTGG